MTFKNMEGEYYFERKKKRDRLTGHVATPLTPVALLGQYYGQGPFVAETIWLCNGETQCAWAQLLDGAVPLTCRILLAPGTVCQATVDTGSGPNFLHMEGVWMPFFTAVMLDASSINVLCAVGGWIP